jgi:hypothetical protein
MTDTGVQAPPRRAPAEKPVQRPIQRCPKGALFLEQESVSPGGRAVWYCRVPHEHTIDDVLSPHYFGALQISNGGLKTGDVIDIEPESGLWFTRARVMAPIPAVSQVKLREFANMRQSYQVKPPQGYRFDWRGGTTMWVVVKIEGDVVVDGGFASQDEAASRISEIES